MDVAIIGPGSIVRNDDDVCGQADGLGKWAVQAPGLTPQLGLHLVRGDLHQQRVGPREDDVDDAGPVCCDNDL